MTNGFRARPIMHLHVGEEAKVAFDRGDHVFQCQIVLEKVTGAPNTFGAGTVTSSDETSVGPILNSVCEAGWSFVSQSVAFIPESTESRDKLLRTGQAAATSGRLVGSFVFGRTS